MAPFLRRTWSMAGQTPIFRQRTATHQKVSASAALCVSPRGDRLRLFFRLHPQANITAVLVRDFLRQLRRQLPGPWTLIWDRLGAHRARMVQQWLARTVGVQTFFFPSYAPELNPVEYVWSYLKTNPLANRALLDLLTLTTTARQEARTIQRQPLLLRSFLDHCPLSFSLK